MHKERVSPTHIGKNIKTGEERWPAVRINDISKLSENNKIGIYNRIERQQIGNKTEDMPNQDSTMFKTEEQKLNEDLLANDSLGG
jgi:hypothetical protein